MKKYLLFFFCIFITTSSFAQDGPTLPADMDLSLAELESSRGVTDHQLIDLLLQNPQWSIHLRVFLWIDELINKNDSEIDADLTRLLTTPLWIESADQTNTLHWINVVIVLIKRKFADNEEVIASISKEIDLVIIFLTDTLKNLFDNFERNATSLSEDKIKEALDAISALLNINRRLILIYKGDYNPRTQDHNSRIQAFINILDSFVSVTNIKLSDPRIQQSLHQIFLDRNLSHTIALSLVQHPRWREHPNAALLLGILIRGLDSHKEITGDIKTLLKDPFWQDHPELKGQLRGKLVTFDNMLAHHYCPSLLNSRISREDSFSLLDPLHTLLDISSLR